MRLRSFLTLVSREWRGAWADRGGYVLRAFYASVLLVGGAGVWGATALLAPIRPEEFAPFARLIFGIFFRFQFALALFLATIAFARGVAREKEHGTMDFLLLSPLLRIEILLGKVLGEGFAMASVLAAGLPVLFFVLPLGGMTLGEILAAQGILLGALLALGGLCAALGAFFVRSTVVMAISWGVLLVVVGPSTARFFWPGQPWGWKTLEALSPFEILNRELTSVGAEPRLALAALGGGFAAMVLLCLLGSFFLERRHVRAGERVRDGGFWKSLGRRMVRAASGRRVGFLFRPVFGAKNPLVRRECGLERDYVFRVGWLFFVALYAGAILAVMAYDTSAENQVALAGVGGVTALLLAILLAAVSVGTDRRRGTFETLLAANVEPEDILKARLAGHVLRGAYLLLPPLVHGGISVFAAVDLPPWELAWRGLLGVGGVGFGLLAAMTATMHTTLLTRRTEVAAVVAVLTAGPAAVVVAVFLAATPVLFAVGAPATAGLLVGSFAQSVRLFRRAALSA